MLSLKNKLEESIIDKNLVNYFVERFESKDYRGKHISQHNRYTIDKIKNILNALKEKGRIEILVADDKGKYPETAREYIKLVNELKENGIKVSINSLKKNLFVDMHRMGLITRFDKDKNEILDPFKRSKCVKYVQISSSGNDFINKSNLKEQTFIYMKAIDNLSNGFIEKTRQFFLNQVQDLPSNNRAKFKITRNEFGLFVTAIDCEFDGNKYTLENISNLYKIWKNLSKKAKENVIYWINKWCDERKSKDVFKKNSTQRDWPNFLNEVNQIINIFSQTSFFDRNDQYDMFLKFGTANSMFDNEAECFRSLEQTKLYFQKHNVDKQDGYRLHHVIRLKEAKNPIEWKLIDVWENMIYIYGGIHDEIHDHNKDKLYALKIYDNNEVDFISIFSDKIKVICAAKYSRFNSKLKDIMLNKNKELLNSLD